MSIIVQRVRRLAPFGPGEPTVPNWPIGIWVSSIIVTGDASGGFREADIIFTLQSSPRLDSLLYGLEHLSLADTQNTTKVADIRTINVGVRPEGDLTEFAITIAAVASGRATGGATNSSGLPMLLGSQLVQGISSVLLVQIGNDLGSQLIVKAAGYVWSSRALSAPGGPQRPPGSIFG